MRIFALALAFLITSCGTTAVISDLESEKVIVQATGGDMSIINAEARRGCAMHNKTASAMISWTCVDGYCVTKRYLYACHSSA
jgi:hypothetical protein